MTEFFTKIAAFFASIITMFTAIFCPPQSPVPEFPQVSQQVKTAFDEGEFVMGEYDLVVSPDGDDSNSGTLENPLKTIEKAKDSIAFINLEK